MRARCYQTSQSEPGAPVESRYLRSAQIEALTTYWFLRLVKKTPTMLDLYKSAYPSKSGLRKALALKRWLVTSKRSILEKEIRLRQEQAGDRIQFQPCHPVAVKAVGQIADKEHVHWTSSIREAGKNVTRPDSQTAVATIRKVFAENANGTRTICPVIAY